MERKIAATLGVALAGLIIVGVTVDNKRPLGLMNVDDTHSAIRVPLAALLLYGAISPLKRVRSILFGAGIIYFVIGLIGLNDRKAGGLLPSGLTGFDLVYHFSVGALCTWLGTRVGRMLKP